ncbi:hypothetical protein F8G81_08575 [Arthrobacter sp. CDRTa11]|uniref:hypothetical protein n=1 Tax=Arthrobacter sp. CDRTa11 TaxID=2651199 RepID=UPI002265C3D7|nr:hypothetical protein [Arthrobacter sp. CDRTa11]UZX02661.1 hypothetical protein F8G81_08575 [Arthrobacter sp. CDRTa11]
MPRPDSGSPDQSANQDDAVWLDLVARLEGSTPDTTSGQEPGPSDTADLSGTSPATGTGPQGSADASDNPAAAGRHVGFRDFDPLGLAAPTELSAAERQAAASPAPPKHAAPEDGDAPGGPRDYGLEDDDDGFVPDEPPSLAGTDPLTMLAWLGAVGGPVALLLSAMFWRSAPLLAILGILAVFILAVVYLIMKLPQEKDENDDGARV